MGILFANVASGLPISGPGLYWGGGPFQLGSGVSYFPVLGKSIYVGRSGQLVTFSGSWNSGGFVSGDIAQVIGWTVNSGALMLEVQAPSAYALSGVFPLL